MVETHSKLLAIPIKRDTEQFLKELLRELAGVLEDAVGLEEAEGFISLVGGRIGQQMDSEYKTALGQERLNIEQVGQVLVDLKTRIDGGFSVKSIDEDKIVMVNTRCPFGEYVKGRESLCMMTSNVFGRISANNLSYSRVEITESIAQGNSGCRVVVHFQTGDEGRDYYG